MQKNQHSFAQNSWDVIRWIAKTGPKSVTAIAKYTHLTVHTVRRMMRVLPRFGIPLYRRTMDDSNDLVYDIDVGRLINQFVRDNPPQDKIEANSV